MRSSQENSTTLSMNRNFRFNFPLIFPIFPNNFRHTFGQHVQQALGLRFLAELQERQRGAVAVLGASGVGGSGVGAGDGRRGALLRQGHEGVDLLLLFGLVEMVEMEWNGGKLGWRSHGQQHDNSYYY